MIPAAAWCPQPETTGSATSDEALGPICEIGWHPSLPVPDPKLKPALVEFEQNSAIQLFLERGIAARHDFVLTNLGTPSARSTRALGRPDQVERFAHLGRELLAHTHYAILPPCQAQRNVCLCLRSSRKQGTSDMPWLWNMGSRTNQDL
jgi:hypothetical protein